MGDIPRSRTSSSPPEIPSTGLSIVVEPDQPTIDVVYIHGFTGDPERTWTCNGSEPDKLATKFQKLMPSSIGHKSHSTDRKGVYWPRDLLPEFIPSARVLVYGYDTNIRHWAGSPPSQNTVYDISWDFLASLDALRRSELRRPIFFIAHSLGGIVVKEALRRSNGCQTHHRDFYEVSQATVGVMFFGTPHGGADPRGMLQHVLEKIVRTVGYSVNEQILNSLLPSAERLKELRDEFSPMARERKWIIYSFQEQYGLKVLSGKKVVDDTSSCLNDPSIETTHHIASNHMDMCRFNGADDVQFSLVKSALIKVVESLSKFTIKSVPYVLNLDEQKKLTKSLQFDQMDTRHLMVTEAHSKTCEWLLNSSEYREWLDPSNFSRHNGFLWLKGKAGIGKSTIMKYALAHDQSKMKGVVVYFFFNARGQDLEKSTLGLYRSLLFQLLEAVPALASLIFLHLRSEMKIVTDCPIWTIDMLKELIKLAILKIGPHQPLNCYIDALDECDEDEIREMIIFFESLGRLAISSQTQLLICLSSRHYPHIAITKGIELVLERQQGHNDDIITYIATELRIGHSKQAEQVRVAIVKKSSGIFMWVVIVVKMLNKEYDRGRIVALRKRLEEIPAGLNDLFEDILKRDSENREDLLLIIQWILFARQPLSPTELYFAVLSGLQPDEVTEWDPEETTPDDINRFLISSSKGLAEITKTMVGRQAVQFIHESVRDFFLKTERFGKLWPDLASNLRGRSHERLKECCQTYMMVNATNYISAETPVRHATFPFMPYAVSQLFYHSDAAQGCEISQLLFITDLFFRDWIRLFNLIHTTILDIWFPRLVISPRAHLLYYLARENLSDLIKIHPDRQTHARIEGELYAFPLLVALAFENEKAIQAFLPCAYRSELETSFPFPQAYLSKVRYGQFHELQHHMKHEPGRTLLSYICEHATESFLMFLLQNQTLIPAPSDTWSLHFATRRGFTTAAKHLIRAGISVDTIGWLHRTPLLWAAENGQDEMIKLLLHEGASLHIRDYKGQTALSWVARAGHSTAVKILLESGADVNLRDHDGRTALSLAAESRSQAVHQLLLKKDGIHVNAADNSGLPPLWHAVDCSNTSLVQLLLETDKVALSIEDKECPSPLFGAVRHDHKEIIQLLLATGKVDPFLKDSQGETALSIAQSDGYKQIAKMLSKYEKEWHP